MDMTGELLDSYFVETGLGWDWRKKVSVTKREGLEGRKVEQTAYPIS